VHELGPLIRADVKQHAAGRPQNDDITLMLVGRNSQGGNLSTHVVDV
jgi:serine phosphatase RsbU (regulator of sigma subunit)